MLLQFEGFSSKGSMGRKSQSCRTRESKGPSDWSTGNSGGYLCNLAEWTLLHVEVCNLSAHIRSVKIC